MSKKYRPQDIGVEVTLKENINPANFSKLILDLAKHLLLLKNQIPLQFEAISKEVEFRNDSYLESKRLELGMDKLSIYREHIRKMKEIAEQMA